MCVSCEICVHNVRSVKRFVNRFSNFLFCFFGSYSGAISIFVSDANTSRFFVQPLFDFGQWSMDFAHFFF